MTRDTVNKAIHRGAGELDGQQLESVVYEGYGPGGTAALVEAMTDNKNRTVASVRHAFSKSGGYLGSDGSVAYLSEKKGVISFSVEEFDEERIMEVALEAGAEGVIENNDGSMDVITLAADFGSVKDALDAQQRLAIHAEVTMIASTQAGLDESCTLKLLRLIDALEDDDDIQKVYHNRNISNELAEKL
ncbi:putative transcriptional regulatory protein [Agarivorans gilvus]|uniref:Transcriptional regulatory protein n=1 Tax=Agarivorans gilvus TaxID=680279 RepID=A0ABQ1I610_9ALTE|nr:putative transcriptional regulatory protein [Agarivorans gilvus]